MRLDRLDLLWYGHLRDCSVDLARPERGLTIVVGPNEAGKSTMMRAVGALLFGIEHGSGDHFGAGRASLRIGALLGNGDGSPVEVVRQGLAANPLVDGDGNPVDQGVLSALLGGIERRLFRTLFCIDHDELRTRSKDLLEADGEIGRLVFGASLGATALNEVLRDLEKACRDLFLPTGERPKLNVALKEHTRLVREAKDKRLRSADAERLENELQDADLAVERLRGESGALYAERNRLQRIGDALPHLAEHHERGARLEELHREGPVPEPDWAADAADALRQRDEAGRTCASAEQRRNPVEGELARLDPPTDLLAARDRIDAVYRGLDRYRKGRDDLPGLEAKLASCLASVRGIQQGLGRGPDDGLPDLTVDQEAAIDDLADRGEGLMDAPANLRNHLADLEARRAARSDELARIPEPPDVSTLRRAHAAALAAGPLEAQLIAAREEHASLTGDATDRLARLGLDDLDQVAGLALPARARVDQERDALARADLLCDQLAEQADRQRQNRQRLESERRDLLAGTPSDRGDLEEARAHRDLGWRLVRAEWLGDEGDPELPDVADFTGGEPLAGAYETAVDVADTIADALLDDAERAARLDAITEDLAALAGEEGERVEAEASRAREVEERAAEWRDIWARCGVAARSPLEMMEWLDGFEGLLAVCDRRRDAGVRVDSLSAQCHDHVEALSGGFALAGVTPGSGSLDALLRQAESVIAAADDAGRQRQAGLADLDHQDSAIAETRRKLEEGTEELGRWRRSWEEVLRPVALPADTRPAAARRVLTEVRRLRSEIEKQQSLEDRVAGLRRDIHAFEDDLAPLLAEVAPDLVEIPTIEAVEALKRRGDKAQQEDVQRAALQRQLDDIEAEIGVAQLRAEQSQADLDRLRQAAELAGLDEVPAAAGRAAVAAELRDELDGIERRLVEQAGKPFAELLAEAEAAGDRDRIAAELALLDGRIEEAEAELDGKNRRLGELRTRYDDIDEESEANALEQRAEEVLAALVDHTGEYVRTALAAALLRRVVAEYGRRHRGPILERASCAFNRITRDGYRELVVDDDGRGNQVLRARRRNGELVHIDALSDGTRDQLYLALRLAGVEHHLHSASPVPLVLDDLFVNFDDDRAAAGLQVLADLGDRTQVLLFTHHDHLVDLATGSLAPERVGVARLHGRDHDAAPLVIRPAPAAPPRVPDARRAAAAGEWDEAVLDCLTDAHEALSKPEILARTDVPEWAWTATIKRLVEADRVVQEGVKRGARYRLA